MSDKTFAFDERVRALWHYTPVRWQGPITGRVAELLSALCAEHDARAFERLAIEVAAYQPEVSRSMRELEDIWWGWTDAAGRNDGLLFRSARTTARTAGRFARGFASVPHHGNYDKPNLTEFLRAICRGLANAGLNVYPVRIVHHDPPRGQPVLEVGFPTLAELQEEFAGLLSFYCRAVARCGLRVLESPYTSPAMWPAAWFRSDQAVAF